MIKQEVQSLAQLIKDHDDLYFNKDAPMISDAEYDELKARYLELSGEDNNIPGEPSRLFENYTHLFPIKSLAKINTEAALRKELIRLAPGVIQPKEDGMTIVLYPDGSIVTRGDGATGENITATANQINNIRFIDAPVRAEAVMDKSVFHTLNTERVKYGLEPFKNPRNTIAGMLRSKDVTKVKGISYKAYNIMGSTEPETAQLTRLKNAGMDTIDTYSYTIETIEDALSYILNFDRTNYPREIDGLVIKADTANALSIYGETGHHPKSMVAYKFPVQGVWTNLKEIIWQVGRTGKLTPVAIIEPAELLGTTISRVTLHNFGIMQALQIAPNCEVYLVKANDIIPAILKTKMVNPEQSEDYLPFAEPNHCPICGSLTEKVNDQLFCNEPNCAAKLLRNLCHIAKRDALDIESMSEETAKKLIAAGFIEKPFDLFDLTQDQILTLPGFAAKSAKRLYDNIQSVMAPDLNRFIYAAGIPNIGRTASKDIANRFKTLDAFMADISQGLPETSQIEGIGPILIESIKKNYGLLIELKQKINPKEMDIMQPTSNGEKVLTFVITGTLSCPREHFERVIIQAGHKIAGSVTKNTDYLLAGDKAGSKKAKAESLGIKILHESQLSTILQG